MWSCTNIRRSSINCRRFLAGKFGNALGQQISYGNIDWGVTNANGFFAAVSNGGAHIGLLNVPDLLSSASQLVTRVLENVAPSFMGIMVSTYLGTLAKPTMNDFRDVERIKSGKGRFIWDYLFK